MGEKGSTIWLKRLDYFCRDPYVLVFSECTGDEN